MNLDLPGSEKFPGKRYRGKNMVSFSKDVFLYLTIESLDCDMIVWAIGVIILAQMQRILFTVLESLNFYILGNIIWEWVNHTCILAKIFTVVYKIG